MDVCYGVRRLKGRRGRVGIFYWVLDDVWWSIGGKEDGEVVGQGKLVQRVILVRIGRQVVIVIEVLNMIGNEFWVYFNFDELSLVKCFYYG